MSQPGDCHDAGILPANVVNKTIFLCGQDARNTFFNRLPGPTRSENQNG